MMISFQLFLSPHRDVYPKIHISHQFLMHKPKPHFVYSVYGANII